VSVPVELLLPLARAVAEDLETLNAALEARVAACARFVRVPETKRATG